MNNQRLIALLATTALSGTLAIQAQADFSAYYRQSIQEKRYVGYQNPVIRGFHPDPSICRVGEDYYLVNSTFQYFPGVPIFHSKDLVNWEQIGNVLTTPTQLELPECGASEGIFAPTIRYHEGRFYMITTNMNVLMQRRPGNLIVTATDPRGPWSEPVYTAGVRGIDPSLFWDDDGRCYCTYSLMNMSIGMFEINPETGEVLSENRTIWNGTGDSSPEGPHIIKKDGYYYLLIAEGGTEMGHKVTIARARNIWGPYDSNPANPIATQKNLLGAASLIQGVGHPDIIQAHDGSWWMVGLCFRTTAGKQLHTLGRETFLAPVRWDEGAWPVVNGNGVIDVEMDVPTLPLVPFEKPAVRTTFHDALGYEWVHVANPRTENYQMEKDRLLLTATSIKLDHPSQTPTAVFRRQEDVDVVATTQVSLSCAKAGDAAGLTVYMDPHGHYDVVLAAQTDGTQAVELRYRLGDLLHIEKSIPLTDDAPVVQLRVEADASHYAFSYSLDGKRFEPLGKMNTFFLATETLGGFTGMMFGLFAEGEADTHATAAFDWFDYLPE